MPKTPRKDPPDETPRIDQAPLREPYYEGYFGTEEEEGVVREEEAGDEEPERGAGPRPEDAAGGDRGI